jgi:hypothetical protein
LEVMQGFCPLLHGHASCQGSILEIILGKFFLKPLKGRTVLTKDKAFGCYTKAVDKYNS